MIYLIFGGAGSGKSKFAEFTSQRFEKNGALYIATMINDSDEAKKRIEKHRLQRMDMDFETFEMPFCDEKLLATAKRRTCLLDCLGNLLANEKYINCRSDPAEFISNYLFKLGAAAENLVVVANDVSLDILPNNYDMEPYLKDNGIILQNFAKIADEVIKIAVGQKIYFKSKLKDRL